MAVRKLNKLRVVKRKCCGCGKVKSRDDMIKITYNKQLDSVQVEPDSFFIGRSAYICRNNGCFFEAFKKGKFYKILKCRQDDKLKEKIRAVLEK